MERMGKSVRGRGVIRRACRREYEITRYRKFGFFGC